MNLSAKKILYIDLTKSTSHIELNTDLKKYIGGVGIGLKILSNKLDEDPVVFSVGPLNGVFPFCSKTSVVTNDNGVIEDIYIGGSLSTRIKFAGIDSIVITGNAKRPVIIDIQNEAVNIIPADTDIETLGLPGKKSVLYYDSEQEVYLVDKYFRAPEGVLERKLTEKNVFGIVITGTKTTDLSDPEKYEELYRRVLDQSDRVTVEKDYYPSCVGCPIGCRKSKVGEIGGNLLPHSLVACTYTQDIFSDIGIVFSCLNFLGYDYTHEDLENFPHVIDKVIKELNA